MDDRTEIVTANPTRLELRAAGRTWQATANRTWTLGRANEADIHLENPRVSRDHAILQPTPAGWVLVNHSNNGMFINGQRVESLTITQPVTVVLGSASSGEVLQIFPIAEQPPAPRPQPPAPQRRRGETTIARPPTAIHNIDQLVVTIGRAEDNNVVLDDLLVSRRHAMMRRSGDQWELVDNNSANGTYVNGNRINRAVLGPNDVVGIGHQLLHLAGGRLVEYVDSGDVSYEASNLRVVGDKNKVLLADISFSLPERSFMAVVGPSGAGKSTLLGALTGFRPADSGEVRYDDRDLYENYAELRHRIGFVPQDDILHTGLTVRRALNYAARLRFPGDVSAQERKKRIDEVMAELGLTEHAHKKIVPQLSGGQRKRTSVALELLTKPSLLFLDEPTSGLDPGLEKSVMQTLRELANDGRSVVVVTHNTNQLNLCDKVLILAPGGRLAYFGPPQQALSYFNCTDFADLFTLLEQDQSTDWTGKFNTSPLKQALSPPAAYKPPQAAKPPSKPPAQQSAFSQFVTLCRRYLAVIAADRLYLATLLLLPLGVSLMAYAVPGQAGMSLSKAIDNIQKAAGQPAQLLVLLVIGGALMGLAASIREIVKERAIYQREHGIGLSRGAYMASKLVVLTVLTSLQALILGLLGPALKPPPDESVVIPWPRVEIALAIMAVTVVSMIIGLVISAMISNADRGMPLLVLVVMAELVLSGGMFGVNGRPPLEQLAWLSPSRWAFAMGASTISLNDLKQAARQDTDPLWGAVAGEAGLDRTTTWLMGAGASAVEALVLVLLLVLALRRMDPHRKPAKRK